MKVIKQEFVSKLRAKIKEEDEQELDEDTGTPVKIVPQVSNLLNKNIIVKEHLDKLKNINVTPLNNYNGQ